MNWNSIGPYNNVKNCYYVSRLTAKLLKSNISNLQFHILDFLPNILRPIVRMITSKRPDGWSAPGKDTNALACACNIFAAKTETWACMEDKIVKKQNAREGTGRIHLAKNRVQWRTLVSNWTFGFFLFVGYLMTLSLASDGRLMHEFWKVVD
jgi:hypothetical protein